MTGLPRLYVAATSEGLAPLHAELPPRPGDRSLTAADILTLREVLAPRPVLDLYVYDWPALPGLLRDLLSGPLARACTVHRRAPPGHLAHLHAPALALLESRHLVTKTELAEKLHLTLSDARDLLEELHARGLVRRRRYWTAVRQKTPPGTTSHPPSLRKDDPALETP